MVSYGCLNKAGVNIRVGSGKGLVSEVGVVLQGKSKLSVAEIIGWSWAVIEPLK